MALGEGGDNRYWSYMRKLIMSILDKSSRWKTALSRLVSCLTIQVGSFKSISPKQFHVRLPSRFCNTHLYLTHVKIDLTDSCNKHPERKLELDGMFHCAAPGSLEDV